MQNDSFKWEAPEYAHEPKRADWFWALGIIAIAAAVTAILLENILFAIIIVIAAVALALSAAQKPKPASFEMHKDGIQVNRTLYPYKELDSFSVSAPGAEPQIIIQSKRFLMPHIVVPLAPDMDPEEIRNFLTQYLEEEERDETLIESIMRFLGI